MFVFLLWIKNLQNAQTTAGLMIEGGGEWYREKWTSPECTALTVRGTPPVHEPARPIPPAKTWPSTPGEGAGARSPPHTWWNVHQVQISQGVGDGGKHGED